MNPEKDEAIKKLIAGQERFEGEFAYLKSDVSTLKNDVSTLKSDVCSLKNDVSTLKEGQSRIESVVINIENILLNKVNVLFDADKVKQKEIKSIKTTQTQREQKLNEHELRITKMENSGR